MTHHPHLLFSRIDHRRSRYQGCECQQCTPTLYDVALNDPELARELFDASKGGNVPGITENHRYFLAEAFQRAPARLIAVSNLLNAETGHLNRDVFAALVRKYARETFGSTAPRYLRQSAKIYRDYYTDQLIAWRQARGLHASMSLVAPLGAQFDGVRRSAF